MQRHIEAEAARLLQLLLVGGWRVSFAESCTGGLAAAAFTACPGASAALEMSFVTYADRAKAELLGVPAELLARYTAVSAPVARAMALGAQRVAGADLALAVTGLAGPGRDELGREAGLVYLAAAWQGKAWVYRNRFPGDRQLVRQQAAWAVLRLGCRALADNLN